MSSDEDEKKKLYELESDYVESLNRIRQQLNSLQVSNDESSENVSHSSSKEAEAHQIELDEDLYKTVDDSYLLRLNAIRKAFQLDEISEEKSCEKNEDLNFRMKAVFSKSSSFKEQCNDTGRKKSEEKFYVPPSKKICIRKEETSFSKVEEEIEEELTSIEFLTTEKKSAVEIKEIEDNEPSEQSSPVKETVLQLFGSKKSETPRSILKHDLDTESSFSSLNAPLPRGSMLSIHPKVTVLSHEEAEVLKVEDWSEERTSEEKTEDDEEDLGVVERAVVRSHLEKDWLMTGLDLPKKCKELYNFPSVVHIAKWGCVKNQQEKVDKLFTTKRVTLNLAPQDSNRSSPKSAFEAETLSSLSKMYHTKRKSEQIEPVPESASTSSIEDSKDDGAVGSFCKCLELCFPKRRKQFFE